MTTARRYSKSMAEEVTERRPPCGAGAPRWQRRGGGFRRGLHRGGGFCWRGPHWRPRRGMPQTTLGGAILSEDAAAGGADGARAGQAIGAHAGEDDAEQAPCADLRGGAKEHVDGGPARSSRADFD